VTPGRRALHEKLERVIDREKIDFTIVNIENAAGGFGVTEAIMEENPPLLPVSWEQIVTKEPSREATERSATSAQVRWSRPHDTAVRLPW